MSTSLESGSFDTPQLTACKWCESPMRISSVRCARCRRFRNDIHNERFLGYVLSGFAVGLAMTGFSHQWWADTVFDGFSVSRFASSGSGWLIMGLTAASLTLYFRVSRKLSSWFWF